MTVLTLAFCLFFVKLMVKNIYICIRMFYIYPIGIDGYQDTLPAELVIG
jgi:hypothetical protein